ncbi:MAG: hypothetical protein R3Y58_13755 [Eubacteriales bacterium]
MPTQLLVLLLIATGGVLGSVVFNKKFEEMFPVTNVFIILFMFLLGIMGYLRESVNMLCYISVAIYGFCAFWLIKNRNIKSAFSNLLTPATVIFLIFYVAITYCNIDRIPTSFDEFSHWADVVKAMTFGNDFSTNPDLNSAFATYPPGVSLFLYFVQKVQCVVGAGENYFSEWRLSFAYQLLVFTFVMPFLKDYTFKKFFRASALFVALFGIPSVYFSLSVYTSTLIDPVLAVLIGVGFAFVFLSKEKDWLYILQVNSVVILLVLAKDAGLLFAIFLWIAFAVDMLIVENKITFTKKNIGVIALSSLSFIVPKQLWSYNISVHDAQQTFAAPYDFVQFFKVLLGLDDTYRTTVNESFWGKFTLSQRVIGDTGLTIQVGLVLIFLLVGTYFIYYKYVRLNPENSRAKKASIILLVIMSVIYIYGTLASYMFKFSEYEATGVASFDRYLDVLLVGIMYFVIITLFKLFSQMQTSRNHFIIFVCILALFMPGYNIVTYFSRTSVTSATNQLQGYQALLGQIEKVEDDAKIYVIAQESTGYDFWVIRYYSRPNTTNTGDWSVGEAFYDGDIWTLEITAEEFQSLLVEEYDYVAIFKANDFLREDFAELFDNPDEIYEHRVYAVNKETGLLELY